MAKGLFDKARIGKLGLKNRILMSAASITWNVNADHIPQDSDNYIHFEIAKGGLALVNTGGLNVCEPGISSAKSGLFADDRSVPFLTLYAKRIKDGGTAASLQITHGGMWAWKTASQRGFTTFAPSYVADGELGDYSIEKRKELPASEKQIQETIEAYGNAALRAKKCGFDAVQVHAAHESLLAQMLSPVTNLRKDQWGGSIENRSRFHRAVLKNIRTKVGPGFPVIMKLGVQDMLPNGLQLGEGVAAAKLIAEAGDVDAIEVSQGLSPGLADFEHSSMRIGITSLDKEGYYRSWTKAVKQAVSNTGVLVVMQGGLRSYELMTEIIQNEEADLVSMCRPYIREPNIVNRWLAGEHKKAACISCNQCILKAFTSGQRIKCIYSR